MPDVDALLAALRASVTRLHDLVESLTPDQYEALAIGNRVAVLHEGRLQQLGTPEEITSRPANEFVSHFFRHVRGGWHTLSPRTA